MACNQCGYPFVIENFTFIDIFLYGYSPDSGQCLQ